MHRYFKATIRNSFRKERQSNILQLPMLGLRISNTMETQDSIMGLRFSNILERQGSERQGSENCSLLNK